MRRPIPAAVLVLDPRRLRVGRVVQLRADGWVWRLVPARDYAVAQGDDAQPGLGQLWQKGKTRNFDAAYLKLLEFLHYKLKKSHQ